MKSLIQNIIKEYMGDPIVPKRSNIPASLNFEEHEKEVQDKFFRVSKTEELQALNFIRNRVMVYAIDVFKLWFKHQFSSKGEHKEFSHETVNKKLKKISDERYPGRRKKDIIQYSAPLVKKYKLTINIFKNEDGELAVGYSNPLNAAVKYFLVHGPEHLTPMYEIDAPKPLMESIEKDWRLTKPEEQKALQFIRNFILPKVIEEYNERAAERKVPLIHHGPEEREIVNSLRKASHTPFLEYKTDQVLYVADFKKWQWVFIIEKVGLGTRIPHIKAGYIDDEWNESKVYDIDNPQWQDPKTSFKRITDYMPGGVGLLSLRKKNRLSESPTPEGFGKHDLRMNKQEEDYAFHLFKREFYDIHHKKAFKKIAHYHTAAPNHVPDKIIYEVVFSNNTVSWYAIGKNSRTGKLVYYLVDKEGNRQTHGEIPLQSDTLSESFEPLNLHISKEEEAWALQQLKKRKNNQGESIGKYLKKIEHTVSTDPHVSDRIKFLNTDDATTYTLVKNRVDGKLGYRAGYKAFKKVTPYGAMERDDYESLTIDDFDILLHEAKHKGPILTKQNEVRGVQFIRNIIVGGVKPYGKTLKKLFIQPSSNPETISDGAYYKGQLSNGDRVVFKIYLSQRLGLIVSDEDHYITYKLDSYNSSQSTIVEENKKDIDPNLLITKKEEAQAFTWLSNLTVDAGEIRFGKNIKKAFDNIENGEHVIKYLVDINNFLGVFSITKNRAGWIIIRSNYGSVMHVIKHL